MKRKFFWKRFAVGLLANFLLVTSSCSLLKDKKPEQITIVIPEQKQSHFDGNEQNGGIIDYTDKGFEITKNAADRYIELTKIYGKDYLPNLKVGEGLIYEDNKIYMTNQYMVEFIVMNDKYRKIIK